MDVARQFTNRCACGWEFRGSREAVVEATLEHATRIHNMVATREQVLATLEADEADVGADEGDAGADGDAAPDVASNAAVGSVSEATAG